MSQPNREICHITTVHPRFDIRIFYKECQSLGSEYSVNLIVADGKGNQTINGIRIYDINGPGNRFNRLLFTTRKAYRKAIELDCEIYHFHDPEFLFYARKLKRKGKSVIYDVHENLPDQIISKNYIALWLRKLISGAARLTEKMISSELTAIITATKTINRRFLNYNSQSIIINNYPILREQGSSENKKETRNEICYIGAITRIRGIAEVIDAIEDLDLVLNLAGNFESEEFKQQLSLKKGWSKVNYLGHITPEDTFSVMTRCFAGLSTLYPEPNYLTSQATKIYEYMYAGLPVIASDFPMWKEFIDQNNCGICVNPKDPKAISNAIVYLQKNADAANALGENGKKAVISSYCWKIEEAKLLNLYSKILSVSEHGS